MIGCALSALFAIYPTQVAHHAQIVWGLLILGVLLFLLEGVVRATQRAAKPPIAEPTVPPSAAAKAKATGNKVDLHFYGTAAPASTKSPTLPATQPPLPAKSFLAPPQFDVQLTEVKVIVGETLVRSAEPGELGAQRCLALHVLNKAAKQGEQAKKAHCIYAAIEFISGSRRTLVSRACWIGHESNQIAIDVSQSELILVGLVSEGDEWVTYNNSNMVDLHMREWYSPSEKLQKRTANWGEGASYTVDVKIISNDRGPTLGETFDHRKFALERRGIAYSAHMLQMD